jgi:hypothetical protein
MPSSFFKALDPISKASSLRNRQISDVAEYNIVIYVFGLSKVSEENVQADVISSNLALIINCIGHTEGVSSTRDQGGKDARR